MDDFWTRLAARALAQAPSVRPRLAPRFAPLAAVGHDPDLAWWERAADHAAETTPRETQANDARPTGGAR